MDPLPNLHTPGALPTRLFLGGAERISGDDFRREVLSRTGGAFEQDCMRQTPAGPKAGERSGSFAVIKQT